MSGQLLVTTITTFVAVIGLTASVIFNFLGRRDALHEQQRSSLRESSKQLVALTPPERVVGMATVIDYLLDPTVGASAQRIALNALHYETEPVIFRIAIDAIRESGLSRSLMDELLSLNRQLWFDLLEKFNDGIGRKSEDDSGLRDLNQTGIQRHLAVLKCNQKIVSQLLKNCSPVQLDCSDAYFPELSAPGATFTDCNFSSALLHYANFRGSRFERCNFDRAILIGAYLEGATFAGCSFADSVVIDVRIRHRPSANPSGLPLELLDSEEPYSSFIYEVEHDWQGHWRGGGSRVGDFHARWWGASNAQVRAVVSATKEGFERRASNDANDGTYQVIRSEQLDTHRDIVLIGGIRTLASRVPGGWRAVWWKNLGAGRQMPDQADISERPHIESSLSNSGVIKPSRPTDITASASSGQATAENA